MAVYKQLLLTTGGGIIPGKARADQEQNVVNIFVGLGGTGGDCLRIIKKAVMSRLKADNDGNEDEEPVYSRIKYIYIDADKNALGINQANNDSDDMLNLDELLDISNDSIKDVIKAGVTNERPYAEWLSDNLDVSKMAGDGAGGFRQAGRYMFMDRADEYKKRLEGALKSAKEGLTDPSVFIHIVSGIGGGTGSGTFLDVCYLTKHILTANGGGNVMGYFFTPDVNLSHIPNHAELTRQYVPVNGYAAMQELEYCMNIGSNGGAFSQNYKNIGYVKWEESPVDMCHLISATDSQMNVIPNAYDYAMNVVAEYVMNFLTEPDLGNQNLTLRGHLSNFTACVNTAKASKQIGTAVNYLALGASCATVPIREINTYLAAGIFKKLGNTVGRKADDKSVFDIADKAGLDRWENVIKAIEENGGSAYIKGPDWKKHKVVSPDTSSNAYAHGVMEGQEETITGIHKTNAEALADPGNTKSYISRIMQQLDACCKDYQRGTDFANSVIVGADGHNLLNIVSGLIASIDSHIKDRMYQINRDGGARANYNVAVAALKNKGNKKNYTYYVYCHEQLNELECEVSSAEYAKTVLEQLMRQLFEAQAAYYGRLNQVFKNLVETFDTNYGLLINGGNIGFTNSSFEMKILTIEDVRENLDNVINAQNEALIMSNLIDLLMKKDNEDTWRDDNKETKLSNIINDFFVKQVFADYAERSITNYLKDKYKNAVTNQQLENNISKDYIVPLISKSEPLFPMNNLWVGKKQEINILSVPKVSQEIINASNNTAQVGNAGFTLNASALTDRIFCMRCICAIPFGVYKMTEGYRNSYFASSMNGKHYYEGKGGYELFNNWNELPFVEPLSLALLNIKDDNRNCTDREKTIVKHYNEFYGLATKYGFFNGYDRVNKLDNETVKKLESIRNHEDQYKNVKDSNALINVLEGIENITKNNLQFVDSGYLLEQGDVTNDDISLKVHKDELFNCPAIRESMKSDIELIEAVDRIYSDLSAKIDSIKMNEKEFEIYCDALVFDIIKFEQPKVKYEKGGMFGISDTINLSSPGEFEYSNLPIYQGFLTYKNMELMDEVEEKVIDLRTNHFNELFNLVKNAIAIYDDKFTGNLVKAATGKPVYEDVKEFAIKFRQRLENLSAEVGL